MSKYFLDVETRYIDMEKLALALVVVSRKLCPYFHAYVIKILTNYLLKQVLLKLNASGRLLKLAIELG